MIVPYKITLVSLDEDLRAAYPWILTSFYANNVEFDGLAQRSAQLLKLIMERGPE